MTNGNKHLRIIDDMEAERRELFVDLINEIQRLRDVNAALVCLCVFIAGLLIWRVLFT